MKMISIRINLNELKYCSKKITVQKKKENCKYFDLIAYFL